VPSPGPARLGRRLASRFEGRIETGWIASRSEPTPDTQRRLKSLKDALNEVVAGEPDGATESARNGQGPRLSPGPRSLRQPDPVELDAQPEPLNAERNAI
jgi:hypothetical protein